MSEVNLINTILRVKGGIIEMESHEICDSNHIMKILTFAKVNREPIPLIFTRLCAES